MAEGYTCDCYQGYELDMTTMTCIGTLTLLSYALYNSSLNNKGTDLPDSKWSLWCAFSTDINECDGGVSVDFPCVNARCVNTEGSFRCICRRGYIMSRRPNHCVVA